METKLMSNQKISKHPGVWLTVFFIFSTFFSYSQNQAFEFKNTPLSEAVKQVATSANISVSFDASALGEKIATGKFSGKSAEDVLSQLLKNSGYRLQFKFGNYLIIPEGQEKAQVVAFASVSGILADKQTGEQLPYATIFLPEKNAFVGTSVNGTFSFRIPESDNLHLKVQYLGYRTIDTIVPVAGSSVHLFFRMKQKNMELAPIQVKKERLKMIEQGSEAGYATVNPVGFVNLPNMGESDAFRTVQLMPGIGYTEGSSGLSIRGGTADQNLILFDGFTLYNLDHFFGTFSSVNPSVVKDIQIYKGGFDSRYGERISGIVDITGKSGNKFKPKLNIGVNLISGNIEAELPISKKLTWVVAARRSYADIYSSFLVKDLVNNRMEYDASNTQSGTSVMQLQPGYYFYDYNSKLTYSKSDNEKMSVSAFGGKDFLSSSGEGRSKQTYSSTTDKNNWDNYGFSFSWLKQWRKSFFSNLQIGYSGYSNLYLNETTVNSKVKSKKVVVGTFESTEENQLRDLSGSLKNQWILGLKNSIDFGFQAKYNDFSYLKSEGVDSYYSDIASSSFLGSTFAQINLQPVKKLIFKIGGRASYYNLSSKTYIEPRASISYQIGNLLKIKAASGRYYQFLSKITPTQSYGYNRDFWVIADGTKHPVLSSDHLIGGMTLTVSRFSFDAEAYYKSSKNLQLFLYIPSYQKNADPNSFENKGQAKKMLPSQFITGTGESVGIDFLLKYESRIFTSWVAYSLSKSVRSYDKINYGEDIPAPFNKRHEIKWVNLLSWKRWNLSSLWIYTTGQPYIAKQTVDKTLSAVFLYDRLPDFKRLDISANYSIPIRKVQVKIGASLINCLNQKNFNDIYSRDFNFETTTFSETTFVRSLGITPNFYINILY